MDLDPLIARTGVRIASLLQVLEVDRLESKSRWSPRRIGECLRSALQKSLGCRHPVPEDWIRTVLAPSTFQNSCHQSKSHQTSKSQLVDTAVWGQIRRCRINAGGSLAMWNVKIESNVRLDFRIGLVEIVQVPGAITGPGYGSDLRVRGAPSKNWVTCE